MDLNSVSLGGRLTADPELRQTNSGHSVCDISLAVNRMKENETDFIDVTLWGKTAEISAQHLAKGRFVNVQGRLKQDKWQDKEGKNRYSMNVVADNIYFGPKAAGATEKASSTSDSVKEETTEAVPF
tara:strand:+ start:2113 stop:2493 length:381 start_codon:yes stop_codon:yes gene_type:complete